MRDIVYVSLISAYVISLIPVSRGRIREAVVWLASLCLLVCICSPVIQASDWIVHLPERVFALMDIQPESVRDREVSAEKWVIRYGVRNIERGVQTLVGARFDMDENSLYAQAEVSTAADGTVVVDRICLFVDKIYLHEKENMASFVENFLLCPCDVKVYP